MEKLKWAWKDPVWSKVIVTAIVAGAGLLVSYWLDWWPTIIAFIADSTAVPNWLLGLLVVMAIGTLGIVGVALWVRFFEPAETTNTAPSGPSPRDYTEDVVQGLRWRWQYTADGHISNLHSFCPLCDLQVFPRDTSMYRMAPTFAYPCEHCGFRSREFEGQPQHLESLVRRYVQRKIRLGEWQTSPPSIESQ